MSKPTLIILPGWSSNKQLWKAFTDLAKTEGDFDVHIIELPCFGSEPCPTEIWGLEEYANFVQTKISKLKIQKSDILLLGHSFGGAVATQLIANNPNIANQLILVGAAIVRKKFKLKRMIFGTFARVGKWVFEIPLLKKHQKTAKKILYKAADSPDYDKTNGMVKEIYKKIIRQDITHLLPNIKTKTTLIWGKRDTYTPLKYAKKIDSLLPNSTLTIMQNGKHGLHHKPHLKEFYSIVKNNV